MTDKLFDWKRDGRYRWKDGYPFGARAVRAEKRRGTALEPPEEKKEEKKG